MTEVKIIEALNRKYINGCRYKVPNVFVFKYDWETDFFIQKQNGYSYEFEVKISRSDFFNDKKKIDKHSIIATGMYMKKQEGKWNENATGWDDRWIYEEVLTEHNMRPNKFFYVVPEGMIKIEEIPDYAGLMYYRSGDREDIITVKDAPFLHKNKLNFNDKLCSKFYHYWLQSKIEIDQLKRQVNKLENNYLTNTPSYDPEQTQP